MVYIIIFILFTLLVSQSVHGNSCTSEYCCASCNEVKICSNTSSGFKELFRFRCPTTAPYCGATGSCSALPTVECGATDSFPCMKDGVFPNPSDCQKYRVCQNGTSYTYTCPSFYNYNSDKGGCVSGAYCYTINCYGKSGQKLPYENDAGIYAYCLNGTAIAVDRCVGPYKLNVNTQVCEPVCQSVGNKVPDVFNCTNFYYCSKEPYATDFTTTNVPCPNGYGFDPRGLRCIPLKMLPTCNPVEQV